MTTNHPYTDQEKPRSSINILVLGDEGVGKSSLISTYVSRHFSEVVPSVMTRVRLPPEPGTQVVTTICDSTVDEASEMLSTSGSNDSLTFLSTDQSITEKTNETPSMEQKVDSIILVYDLDRIETFVRLENYWLPMIERYYDGEIPVIVAGNKMDLVLQTSTGMVEEQSLVRSRQQLIALLQRFRFVRQCIKCSAKNLLRVSQVFVKAQQAVLYPFSPLFNLTTGELTSECKKAFTRIFRMYDQDNDGLLSNAELDTFQYQTFLVPLVEQDLAGWKKVVGRHAEEQVVKDGKFTRAGFLAIFDVFISQNRLDVPWKVLRKFGYSDSLDLAIPKQILDNKFPSLSTASRKFLLAIFYQFDSDKDGILSSDDIKEIFSIVPKPTLPPWHPFRAKELLKGSFSSPKDTFGTSTPEDSTTNTSPEDLSISASAITIASAGSFPTVGDMQSSSVEVSIPPMTLHEWMGHWHMLTIISPSAANAELYRLGHKSIRNPKTRRLKNRRREKELSVLIVGSQGCGKTSLIQLLLQRDPHETEATTTPETSTTHYEYPKRIFEKDEKGEDIVVHFIFTEIPFSLLTRENFDPLISISMDQKILVVFCFDTEQSLLDAIKSEETILHDDIARVFVVAKNKIDDEKMQSLHRAAEDHCRKLDLELPFSTNTFDADKSPKEQRELILKHFAQCGLQQSDESNLKKSKPHAEQKRREAEKRRTRKIWFGGFFAVVAVVGVGVLWKSVVNSKERKSGGWWLTNYFFGRRGNKQSGAHE